MYNLTQSQQIKDPLVGTLFGGRYQIERLVARSAMSVVYRAVDTTGGAAVAVKLLNGCLLTEQDSMARFHREAQIARSLMHPNICALLDHGVTADGTPYHVMEYIPGQTLEDVLQEVKAFNGVEALPIFVRICRALQYLHSRGIVHRDIKPANVMVIANESRELGVKVIDFGVAKGTRKGVHDQVDLTRPGEVFGSLLYTPPERLMGQPADERSDIYSLGCVMYELLAGVNPFAAEVPAKIADKQLRLTPESMMKYGVPDQVARVLDPIVGKTLQKNPDERYQSVAELRSALEHADTPLKMAYIQSDPQRQTRSHPRQRPRMDAWMLLVRFTELCGAFALLCVVALFIARVAHYHVKLPFGF